MTQAVGILQALIDFGAWPHEGITLSEHRVFGVWIMAYDTEHVALVQTALEAAGLAYAVSYRGGQPESHDWAIWLTLAPWNEERATRVWRPEVLV